MITVSGVIGINVRVSRSEKSGQSTSMYILCDDSQIAKTDLTWAQELFKSIDYTYGNSNSLSTSQLQGVSVQSQSFFGGTNYQWYQALGKYRSFPISQNTTGERFWNLYSGNEYDVPGVGKRIIQHEGQPISQYRVSPYNKISSISKSKAALILVNWKTGLGMDWTWKSGSGRVNFPDVFDRWEGSVTPVVGELSSTHPVLATLLSGPSTYAIGSPSDLWIFTKQIGIGSYQLPNALNAPRKRPTPPPAPPAPPAPPPIKEEVTDDPAPPIAPLKAPTVVEETVDPSQLEINMNKMELIASGSALIEGLEYPVYLPTPRDMPGQTTDLTKERVDNTAQGVDSATYDGKGVAIFEISQPDLKKIMDDNTELTTIGKNVIIKNKDTEGYRLPVGFLDKEWTYSTPHVHSVLIMAGEKTIRISDEGKLMITIKTKYGLYNYIFMPIIKEQQS
jgi:hypothetical protein